jgi:2'-5' RNA ligase
VPADNLHVTIWFLGEVEEAKAERVVHALRQPLGVPPITLRIEGAGAFPASGEPRALWLGLTSGREGLLAVHGRLTPRLRKLGFEPERRQFSAHLTIGRVKEARRSEVTAIRRVLHETDRLVGECEVTHATLFRSRTSPAGAQYETLLRIPLE